MRDRLDDPQVAAALNTLLDHADVLAVLVSGLDGFVRRGDTITSTLSSAVSEFRGASSAGAIPGAEAFKGVDLQTLAASLATLSGSVAGATPALNTLLTSKLTDPQAAQVLASPATRPHRRQGRRGQPAEGPVRAVQGHQGSRRLPRPRLFLLAVAKSFGRRVGQ